MLTKLSPTDDAEIDSISKSVYSNDSINTLSNNTQTTVQSDSDSAVIKATTASTSDDGDGDDMQKVSRKASKTKTLCK